MTTYLLLALTDDGRVSAQSSVKPFSHGHANCACDNRPTDEVPVRTGTDRNAYSTYEVAGYSIDVVRLPEPSRVVCGVSHPWLPGVACAMPADHVPRGQDHIGKGYSWRVVGGEIKR